MRPQPNLDRLKRRMVQDLVQQNVDLWQGQAAVAARRARGHRRRLRLAGALALLLVSSALVGATGLLSSRGNQPQAPTAVAAVAGSGAVAARTPLAGLPGGAAALAAPPAPSASAPPASSPAPGWTSLAPGIDASVLPLAVRKIAIDAGHGGDSQGTRTPQGLLEKDLTLDIAQRLRQLLQDEGAFQVVMTRTGDSAVSLAERAAIANREGADVFVSVHVNWIEDHAARGVETYFLGPTNDPVLSRLAATENRDSGYSMADMRNLLDRIYAGVRQDKSRQLARMVQASLFRSLGRINPKVEDRGVKSAPFIVLLSTQMPAILAEVSCLSNEEEARMLAKPLYRQYIALALAEGLRSYASAARGAGR